MAQTNLSAKQKQTHRHGEQTCGCQGGEGWSGIDGEFGVDSKNLTVKFMWISSGQELEDINSNKTSHYKAQYFKEWQ